jgi:hypothetical protein
MDHRFWGTKIHKLRKFYQNQNTFRITLLPTSQILTQAEYRFDGDEVQNILGFPIFLL